MDWAERMRREAESYIKDGKVNDPVFGPMEIKTIGKEFQMQVVKHGRYQFNRYTGVSHTGKHENKIAVGQWYVNGPPSTNASGEGMYPSQALEDLARRVCYQRKVLDTWLNNYEKEKHEHSATTVAR